MCNVLSGIFLCKMVKINARFDVQRDKLQLCEKGIYMAKPSHKRGISRSIIPYVFIYCGFFSEGKAKYNARLESPL